MGARRVEGHDNGHTARSELSARVAAGVHWCRLTALGNLAGDMRPLLGRPFKCSACGSREASLWLFAKRAEAEDWEEQGGLVFRRKRPPTGSPSVR
jgi:hypothetical protein